MKKIIALLHTEGMRYVIFGVLTTVINILAFMILEVLGVRYTISNIIAFIVSIIFAFITNKIYVFESKGWQAKVVLKEGMAFLLARLATFLIDMGLMVGMVEYMGANTIFAKCLVNVIVIIINYVLSKLVVFKSSKDKNNE